jgi:hypothetical protein
MFTLCVLSPPTPAGKRLKPSNIGFYLEIIYCPIPAVGGKFMNKTHPDFSECNKVRSRLHIFITKPEVLKAEDYCDIERHLKKCLNCSYIYREMKK